jgi:hypothetical protein
MVKHCALTTRGHVPGPFSLEGVGLRLGRTSGYSLGWRCDRSMGDKKSEVISKVTKMWVGTRGQKHLTLYKPGREWSGKTFWLSIQVWFGHHRNMYYSDMKSISETHYTPILEGLNTLTEKRGWMVKVLSTPSVKISYFHFSKNKRFHLSSQDSSQSGGKEWLESILDEHRGWKKNYLQAGYLITVRAWEIIR